MDQNRLINEVAAHLLQTIDELAKDRAIKPVDSPVPYKEPEENKLWVFPFASCDNNVIVQIIHRQEGDAFYEARVYVATKNTPFEKTIKETDPTILIFSGPTGSIELLQGYRPMFFDEAWDYARTVVQKLIKFPANPARPSRRGLEPGDRVRHRLSGTLGKVWPKPDDPYGVYDSSDLFVKFDGEDNVIQTHPIAFELVPEEAKTS